MFLTVFLFRNMSFILGDSQSGVGVLSCCPIYGKSYSSDKVRLLFGDGRDDRIRGRFFYLSYVDCSMLSKQCFEEGLRGVFRKRNYMDVRYYGCREQDAHGKVNYHVMINTGRDVFLPVSQARDVFRVDGNECVSLEVFIRSRFSSVSDCVSNHVRFCDEEMGGDCFGSSSLIREGEQSPQQTVSHILDILSESGSMSWK